MSPFETVLRGLVVVSGLFLPGAGWALGGRWPLAWFAAAVISTLAILAGVVGFASLGIAISLGSMGTWLFVVAAAGGMYWWKRRSSVGAERSDWAGSWLAWPILPMLAVAVWRAVAQPLPGADADFRWDHLARLLVQTGALDHYPPVTAEAFGQYFWADGIAPLVSGVYAWTYLAGGSMAKVWTAIPVLFQVLGLLALAHALARCWQPAARAGWLACGLVGATMLLQFSVSLGQETGFTALGAGGMILYLMHWRKDGAARLLVPAALCAGLAACAREYGALFGVIGFVWVGWSGKSFWKLILFGGISAALPLGWHLRVWLMTGNPLFAHDVHGLFPLNPVFHEWMRGYVATYGSVFSHASGWWEMGRLLGISSIPATAGLVAGMFVWRRHPGAIGWVAVGLGTAAVWVASVPFTAGGLFYSMRVLSPLLLLGCAWGGAALARWVPKRQNLAAVLLGLALFGVDASLRALTIPLNPYATAPGEWLQAGYQLQADFTERDEPFIQAVTRRVDGRVLSESAGVQHVFLREGKILAPLWSPDVQFLFDADFHGDAVGRLRDLGYSHLLLTRVQSSVDFLARTGALAKLDGRIEPVMANGTFILFALKPAGSKPAP
jgi:hypothetical protein